MAGQKITKAIGRRLDAYGEEKIFELYLKHRDVRTLLKNLPPKVGKMSTGAFYKWLKADTTQERWNRWQQVKQIIATDLVEEGLRIVDDADDGSVPAARLRSEMRRWIAERYDRAAYGKPDAQVNVAVGIGDADWAAGLKAVEAKISARRKEEAKNIVVESPVLLTSTSATSEE